MLGIKNGKLEDVLFNISTGLNPRSNFKLNETDAENFYVTVKEINTGKILFSNNTDKISGDAKQKIVNRSKLDTNDILLSGIGTIGKVALVDIPTNNWDCSESVFVLKPNEQITPKYLKYLLECDKSQNYLKTNARGSTLKGIRQTDLKQMKITSPPLFIQQKIVEVLDKFEEISNDAQKGLQLNIEQEHKRYEYYRNKLLAFKEKVN